MAWHDLLAANFLRRLRFHWKIFRRLPTPQADHRRHSHFIVIECLRIYLLNSAQCARLLFGLSRIFEWISAAADPDIYRLLFVLSEITSCENCCSFAIRRNAALHLLPCNCRHRLRRQIMV